MNGNYGKFLACMKKLKRVPVDTFENKIICMKLAYILQAMKIPLGYDDWGINVRGVYSVKFAEDNQNYLKSKKEVKN